MEYIAAGSHCTLCKTKIYCIISWNFLVFDIAYTTSKFVFYSIGIIVCYLNKVLLRKLAPVSWDYLLCHDLWRNETWQKNIKSISYLHVSLILAPCYILSRVALGSSLMGQTLHQRCQPFYQASEWLVLDGGVAFSFWYLPPLLALVFSRWWWWWW